MGFKELVGTKMNKNVKFMNTDVKICKLSVAEVMRIQEAAKDIEKDDTKGFSVLKSIIRMGAEGTNDISDEDFDSFPMDELSKLSNSIMEFSGISGGEGKAK